MYFLLVFLRWLGVSNKSPPPSKLKDGLIGLLGATKSNGIIVGVVVGDIVVVTVGVVNAGEVICLIAGVVKILETETWDLTITVLR